MLAEVNLRETKPSDTAIVKRVGLKTRVMFGDQQVMFMGSTRSRFVKRALECSLYGGFFFVCGRPTSNSYKQGALEMAG